MPVSRIVCCSAVSFGFSTLAVDEVDDEFADEFEPELLLAVFVFVSVEPVNCLSLSPNPQNVSAKDISPKVRSDFTESAARRLNRKLRYCHRNRTEMQCGCG